MDDEDLAEMPRLQVRWRLQVLSMKRRLTGTLYAMWRRTYSVKHSTVFLWLDLGELAMEHRVVDVLCHRLGVLLDDYPFSRDGKREVDAYWLGLVVVAVKPGHG